MSQIYIASKVYRSIKYTQDDIYLHIFFGQISY